MRLLVIFISSMMASNVLAQITSTQFRDAAANGPFPIYIGIGASGSYKGDDFATIRDSFTSFTGTSSTKKRLWGGRAFIGVSIIPEDAKLSWALELRYLSMRRYLTASPNTFELLSRNVTFGAGIRKAIFPFVFTVQGGPILYYRRDYIATLPGSSRTVQHLNNSDNLLKQWNVLGRISLLDPAGTEGGWGLYLEYNYDFLRKPVGTNNELTAAIRTFDASFTAPMKSQHHYGYFSFGVLLPIAIKVK